MLLPRPRVRNGLRQSGTSSVVLSDPSLRCLRALCASMVDFSSRHSLRTIKVVGAGRTWYLHAGTELIAEFEDAASAVYTTPTSPGGAGSDSGALFLYQHGDHLTGRLTTDQQGNVSNEQGHYPYGESWYATGAADPSVERKFTSYLKDAEVSTGRLSYAVAREHSARVGRFLRADPLLGNMKNPQRLNRYAYVANQPISRHDPDGRDIIGDGWGVDDLGIDFDATVNATFAWGMWKPGDRTWGHGGFGGDGGFVEDRDPWKCWKYYACLAVCEVGCTIGIGSVGFTGCASCTWFIEPTAASTCVALCGTAVVIVSAYTCWKLVCVPSCRIQNPGCG